MNTLKITAATLALALFAGSAQAQDVGATVTGNDGNPIGTVISNDGTTVTIDTGAHQVPLGPESFAIGDNGPTLNTTKTELDAIFADMAAQQAAALQAALVAGAAVVTADALPLGTIETINDADIVIAKDGTTMALPKDLFALDAQGAVMVLANLSDIEAALAAQAS